MDPFTAFILFAILLVLENLAAQAWWPPYFRFGLPVFFSRAALPGVLDAAETAQALAAQFKANPLHPTIRFKPLGTHQVALREALFEPRGGVSYLPVMRLLVRLKPDAARATLTGYLNGWVLATLAYLPYRALSDRSFLPVALLVLLILGFSYLMQAGVGRKVNAALQDLAGPG